MRSLSSCPSSVSCPDEQKSDITGVALCNRSYEGHNVQKDINSEINF